MCRRPKKGRFFLGLGRFWTFCPLRDLSPLQGPLRADRLTGRPLTGRLLTGGLLRGGFLREAPVITGKLTGRLGPYGKPLTRRDDPYEKGRSLTGYGRPLTGRPPLRAPDGKAPYGEAFLREGPLRITGKLTGSYGEGLYQNWREFPLVCRSPKKVVFS